MVRFFSYLCRLMGNVLGNIITDATIKMSMPYNIVSDTTDIINGLPTLIIGKDFASGIIGDDFNINKKRYSDDVWWTFGRRECRWEHEDDLMAFEKYCIQRFCDSFSYKYVDVSTFSLGRIKSFLKFCTNKEEKYFSVKGGSFLYIYIPATKTVLGVSLSLMDYMACYGSRSLSDRFLKLLKERGVAFMESNDIPESVPEYCEMPFSATFRKKH